MNANKRAMDIIFGYKGKKFEQCPADKAFGEKRHAVDEKALELAEKRLEDNFDKYWENLV